MYVGGLGMFLAKMEGPLNLPTGPIQGLAQPFPFLDVVCVYAPRAIAAEAHRR